MKLVEQGDVVLVPLAKLPPKSDLEILKKGRGIVVAEGEVTGHAHRVIGVATLARNKATGDIILIPDEETTMEHDTHHSVPVEGPAIVEIVQERDHLTRETRKVRD